jgi:hypothetical protein
MECRRRSYLVRDVVALWGHRVSERKSWPGPEYIVRTEFHAPREFAFSWCTDFGPGDAKLEGEAYLRRVLSKNERRVIYEDLEEIADGWSWARYVVDLHPPSTWHMESVGNRRRAIADYSLKELPHGRTQFELRWRRRPSLFGFPKRSKRTLEKETTAAWRRFARALERDYRRKGKRGRSENR